MQYTIKTIWTLVDGYWKNIYHSKLYSDKEVFLILLRMYLSDYLESLGLWSIPDSITYFTAENANYYVKYRVYGGRIIIYVKPLN